MAAKPTVIQLLDRIEELEKGRTEAVQLAALGQTIGLLDQKLDRLMQMVCPVCGPKLVDEMHPEVKAEIRDVAAAIGSKAGHRNGHAQA